MLVSESWAVSGAFYPYGTMALTRIRGRHRIYSSGCEFRSPDRLDYSDTFARMLALEGFAVRTAVNPEVGLELAESERPDAVVL